MRGEVVRGEVMRVLVRRGGREVMGRMGKEACESVRCFNRCNTQVSSSN